MGLTDRLNDLKTKATDAATEHNEQLHEAVGKAAASADQRTDGKYHGHIQKAAAKADSLVESMKASDEQAGADEGEGPPAQ